MNKIFSVLGNMISLLGAGAGTQGAAAVDPIYNAISTIGPYAMGVVLALGLIYAVILGYKFTQAEGSDEKKTLQKALINGIIGFVTVFILIAILYAIRGPLVDWMNS